MTLGDKIRSMTDPELADFLTGLITDARHLTVEKLGKQGITITMLDMPYVTRAAILANLRKSVEEDKQ